MSHDLTLSPEDLERLGDDASSAGRLDEALSNYAGAYQHYADIFDRHLEHFVETHDVETFRHVGDAMIRITAKMRDVPGVQLPPPRSLAERADDLRAEADEAVAAGRLARAAHAHFRLGETLEEMGVRDAAESAYRQSVAFARQVDTGDPELMLAAFCSLIAFLGPSEESIALAAEMGANLITRDEMYHPMRAADAAYHWSVVEIEFAKVTPSRVDHVIEGIVRHAIDMLDEVCFHDKSQVLQRHVAAVLGTVGRHAEADEWQAAADGYEDWELFMEQEIPGHVHLWDIRGQPGDES